MRPDVFCIAGGKKALKENSSRPFSNIALRNQFLPAYSPSLIAACAAASRAIGTRKGEQDT